MALVGFDEPISGTWDLHLMEISWLGGWLMEESKFQPREEARTCVNNQPWTTGAFCRIEYVRSTKRTSVKTSQMTQQ